MIIESVRSVAVPEEGKFYRKIKVSSDVKSHLAPDVIKHAVGTYVKEKVNHILRGDCVVEVHWNGADIRTLHLRSIQPLSQEEVALQRKTEAAARKNEALLRNNAPVPPTNKDRPLQDLKSTPAKFIIKPASSKSNPPNATPSLPSTSDCLPPAAPVRYTRLGDLPTSVIANTDNQQSLPGCRRVIAIRANGTAGVRQLARPTGNIVGQVSQTRKSTPVYSTPLLVPHPNGTFVGTSVPFGPPVVNRLVSTTSAPTMIAHNNVRVIVPGTNPLLAPPTSNGTTVQGPRLPIMRVSLTAPRPTEGLVRIPHPSAANLIRPPRPRAVRIRAPVIANVVNAPGSFLIFKEGPTPTSDIIPASTAGLNVPPCGAEQRNAAQPKFLPRQLARKFAPPTPFSSIAPVVTVRQVATSNPNLNVRVNGSVIRAVPGQVIRRVTGEIVRVLENGSLEAVNMQVSPKPIVTSRDQPISLDSESDSEGSSSNSSLDSDVVKKISKKKNVANECLAQNAQPILPSSQSAGPHCGIAVHGRAEVKSFESQKLSKVSLLQNVNDTQQRDEEDMFEKIDLNLLLPKVDLTEGEPFNVDTINQHMNKRTAIKRRREIDPNCPSLVQALIEDEDGEVKLDPELYGDFIEKFAISKGLLSPQPMAHDLSYLFRKKPRLQSECPRYIPVPKKDLFDSVNISRSDNVSSIDISEDSSTDTGEDDDDDDDDDDDEDEEIDDENTLQSFCVSETQEPGVQGPNVRVQKNPRTYSKAEARVNFHKNVEKRDSQCTSKTELTSTESQSQISQSQIEREESPAEKPAVKVQTVHFYKGVKLSEPIQCREPFVVMDRLKSMKMPKTVYLSGAKKSRTLYGLFEEQKEDLYFDVGACCVNPKTRKLFDSLRDPLRPVRDPDRGKTVARMAKYGVPTAPTCSKSVNIPCDPLVKNTETREVVNISTSRKDVIDADSVYIEITKKSLNDAESGS